MTASLVAIVGLSFNDAGSEPHWPRTGLHSTAEYRSEQSNRQGLSSLIEEIGVQAGHDSELGRPTSIGYNRRLSGRTTSGE